MHCRLLSSLFIALVALTAFTPRVFAAGGAALEVVKVDERLYQGKASLAITLSDRLDPSKRHDAFFEVSAGGMQVGGGWILAENHQLLYFPHVEPETTYEVRVLAGLTASNGNVLVRTVSEQLRTRAIRPSLGFASHGSVLPARLTPGLPIRTVNVDAVDIEFLRVHDDKLAMFAQLFAERGTVSRRVLDRLHRFVDSVYVGRFETHGERNQQAITNVPVEEIPELQRPGVYIAVMRAPARFERRDRVSFFTVTDIGLHVRRYPDSLAVFASSLETGKALEAVELVLRDQRGRSIATTRTDAEGRARMDIAGEEAAVLTGAIGSHTSLVYLKHAALDLSEYAIAGRMQREMEAFVYTPRDLYRPGETVEFSALLRSADGGAVPGIPLHARLKRADGRVVGDFVWRAGAHGYYGDTFAIPSDAPTGEWRLEIRAEPGQERPLRTYPFKVEEFLPERMKLALSTEQASLRPDEPFTVDVLGEYLYGAPADGNRFTASLNLSQDLHPVAALPDFHFGKVDDVKTTRRELADAALDASGRHRLTFKPLESPPTSPVKVLVWGSVYETGGRPVNRALSRTIWPASRLVGIRPLFDRDRVEYHGRAQFEIVAANADGELLGAQSLEVHMIREGREYHWEYDESRGWRYDYTEAFYPVHRQRLDIPPGGRASVTVPVDYGPYRLEVVDPQTNLTASYRFYAGWYYWQRDAKERGATRPDQVTLTLDKQSYLNGDVAKLTITPPHAGDAIVMVEGDRALWAKRLSVPASPTTLDIPIGYEWRRHDLYVTVLVLRPAGGVKSTAPARALGVVHLPLDREARRLQLAIDAPEMTRPEEDLQVAVKVSNLEGRHASVTVAAVDVGVLGITDFETPDPHAYFFAQRAYSVAQHDLYGDVIEGLPGPRATLRYGGDADTGGLRGSKRLNAEVKILSLFSGPVDLDDNGEATVVLPLPDFNGRVRLMAVAFGDERFGAAKRELVVRAPVVAEIAMPRFLASGDRSTVTLDLHNLSGREQNVSLTVHASGPLNIAAEPRELSLRDGEKTTLRYGLGAGLDLGIGTLALDVRGAELSLQRSWQLAVRPPFPGELRSRRTVIEPGDRLDVDPALVAGLMPSSASLSLTVSPLPPLNLRGVLEGLLGYPYGCAEQTTSKAFALIYADQTAQARFGLEPVSGAERGKRVQKAFTRLAGMQNSHGGFGLWRGDTPTDSWLSAYVTHFLVEAREQGFAVPGEMLGKAVEGLHTGLQSASTFSVTRNSSAAYRFSAKAYAAYVLALVDRAPLGTLRTLYDHHREDAPSGLALVQLGIALRMAGDPRRGDDAIALGLEKRRPRHAYYGDYGTRLRDAAAMLYLLNTHRADAAGHARELIFELDQEIGRKRYFSTQERNAVFMAGLSLPEHEQRWQGTLRTGARETVIDQSKAYRGVFDVETLNGGLSIESEVEFPLYAHVEANGYGQEPPESTEGGIEVRRRLLDLSANPVEDRPLDVGELLLVHATVNVEADLADALFVDLLPAGLELENQDLAHVPKLQGLALDGTPLRQLLDSRQIRHQEFRDDRFVAAAELSRYRTTHLVYLVRVVTPGHYRWAAPLVEDMYRPELRAIGPDSRELVVRSRLD